MTDNDDNQRGLDASFEDEVSSRRVVTIPLREYDKLQEQKKYITDHRRHCFESSAAGVPIASQITKGIALITSLQ